MTLAQIQALLERYKQNGEDMNALADVYQALTATGKTPLGLNQWVRSDKPTMEDFNEDNRIIDEALRGKVDVGGGWVTCKLSNGITAPDIALLKCCKEGRVVALQGVVEGISNGSVLTVLPAGYRPTGGTRTLNVSSNAGVTAAAAQRVKIKSDGEVSVVYAGETTHMRLDDVIFMI